MVPSLTTKIEYRILNLLHFLHLFCLVLELFLLLGEGLLLSLGQRFKTGTLSLQIISLKLSCVLNHLYFLGVKVYDGLMGVVCVSKTTRKDSHEDTELSRES